MPGKIEDTLPVLEAFNDPATGVEYRPGDRVQVRYRGVRKVALEHPDWFAVEFETAPVDTASLRDLEVRFEGEYQNVKRERAKQKELKERALREELKHQDEQRQPELERRFKKQEAERERREKARREQAERNKIEAELDQRPCSPDSTSKGSDKCQQRHARQCGRSRRSRRAWWWSEPARPNFESRSSTATEPVS